MRDGFNLSGARRILDIAEHNDCAVVHSHGYKTNILLAIQRSRPLPVVTTLHGWTAKKTLSKLGLYRLLDQRLLSRLDAIVLVNEQLRNDPAISRLAPSKLHMIPNGIADLDVRTTQDDVESVALTKRIADLRRRTSVVIGAVGRLSPEKNFLALIEALSSTQHKVGLVILGDGPQAAEALELISRRGLTDRVVFGGYVRNSRRLLPWFDMLVIPSLTEGLPMVLLEAMSINLPVIATSVGAIPQVLGEFGLLVAPGDVPALATAIERVSGDLQRFKTAASGSAAYVASKYSATAMSSRYTSVYNSVSPSLKLRSRPAS
jgi:glycosyltransferase involved in cell wall biosynthesis